MLLNKIAKYTYIQFIYLQNLAFYIQSKNIILCILYCICQLFVNSSQWKILLKILSLQIQQKNQKSQLNLFILCFCCLILYNKLIIMDIIGIARDGSNYLSFRESNTVNCSPPRSYHHLVVTVMMTLQFFFVLSILLDIS